MTLRNMRIFLAVADCGSMSEAAKRLSIAQPSVSGTIAEIEEQYGVRLFERLGRKLYITPTGESMEKYSRHILSMFDDMELEMKNANENVSLHIGATITVGTCIMCDLLECFRQRCQMSVPRVYVYNTTKIEEMLLHSELDVGIIEGTITNKDLQTRIVMRDPLVLIASAEKNPFAGRTVVRRTDLIDIPFIMREPGSGTRALFEQAMGNIPILEQWTSSNSEAILTAVERGIGCAVMSERLAKQHLETGKVVKIAVADAKLERNFVAVWHKNKFIGKQLQQFLELCNELQ